MHERACPVCGKVDRSVLVAQSNVDNAALGQFAFASRKLPEYMHHRLLLCRRCDLLYASPIPSASSLANAYEAAAFDSATEARFAAHTYGRSLPWIVKRLPDRNGALDIGTGDGAFLHVLLAADFTNVIGVEPSAAPIAAAEASVRPLIRNGVFKIGTFAAGQFSVVTCFQTLEHVTDPLAMCSEAWRILKPGGAIFVAVHNRRALSAKILGRKSPIFDVEHLQLFSRASMRNLLREAGFTDVRVHTLINRYPVRYWARLSPLPSGLKPRVIGWLERVRVGRLPIPLPAGNIVAVGFKPSQRLGKSGCQQSERRAAAAVTGHLQAPDAGDAVG